MYPKKEIVVLVLIFLLLLSMLYGEIQQNSSQICAVGGLQCQGVRIKDEDGSVPIHTQNIEECRDGNNPGCKDLDIWGWGWRVGEQSFAGDYCDNNDPDESLPGFPPSSGCYVAAVDFDEVDDVCGYATVAPGERIFSTPADAKEITTEGDKTCFGNDCSDDDFRNLIVNGLFKWRWYIEPGGICANDHFWYTCSAANEFGSDSATLAAKLQVLQQKISAIAGSQSDEKKLDTLLTHIPQVSRVLELARLGIIGIQKGTDSSATVDKYFCLNTANGYKWITMDELLVDDYDADGVPAPWDCNINDPDVYGDTSLFSGEKVVPICGDGKSNTCGFVANENDECGQNKDACEQNCLVKGTSCAWIDNAAGGNACCGDKPLEDLGTTSTGSYSGNQGNFLCVTKDKDLAGYVGQESEGPKGWSSARCAGYWCWIKAADVQAAFNIYSIKKPGEQPYDVVSNSFNWAACNANFDFTQFSSPAIVDDNDKRNANRFICYHEGNRWSFAQCGKNSQVNNGVKERNAGDGKFALPIDSTRTSAAASATPPPSPPSGQPATPPDGSQPTGSPSPPANAATEARNRIQCYSPSENSVTFNLDRCFEDFYGQKGLDLTGYTSLEFMLRLTTPPKAATEVKVEFFGDPGQKLYESGNVLALATNTPLLEKDRWMHIVIPIPALLNVKRMKIGATGERVEDHRLEIRNVFFSQGTQAELCSGDRSSIITGVSAWLRDIDDVRGALTGRQLCNELYDPTYDPSRPNEGKAWLSDDLPTGSEARRCCGDDVDEFYADDLGPENSERRLGCWNSNVVSHGDTVMNVELEVGYQEEAATLNFQEVTFSYVDGTGDNQATASINGRNVPSKIKEVSISKAVWGTLTDCPTTPGCSVRQPDAGIYLLGREEIKLQFVDSRGGIVPDNPTVELYFFDSLTNRNLGTTLKIKDIPGFCPSGATLCGPQHGSRQQATLHVMANFKSGNSPVTVVRTSSTQTKTFSFTCNKAECIYPLPGKPPYIIKNPHEGLYELYFAKSDRPEDQTLIIGSKTFNEPGNIIARKVPRQVLFIHETNPQGPRTKGFFGCTAADYVDDKGEAAQYFTNDHSCKIRGNFYCAPSVLQDNQLSVNSWSNLDLTKVGYTEEGEVGNNIGLTLKTVQPPLKANTLRNFSVVVPGRNIIPNALFTAFEGNDILGWDILDGNNKLLRDERTLVEDPQYINEHKFITLPPNHKFRTVRIPVPPSTEFHHAVNSTNCQPTIYLVDKNGISTTTTTSPTFNTGTASYIVVEYQNCQFKDPLLQRVDTAFPSATFNFQEQENILPRAALACCPDNYCWNGYACVEPMNAKPQLTEQVDADRNYRCIEGKWTFQPLKRDWNEQIVGFCPQETQCFVLKSGNIEKKAADFYNGEYPICINNGEFIFDHLCQQGNWTSRTKFLAAKLLTIAQRSDGYTLYCTDFRDTLPELQQGKDVLEGTTTSAAAADPTGVQETKSLCFERNDLEWNRLVKEKENTCINNVCILAVKDGSKTKVAMATSLNKPINDSRSFLLATGAPPQNCAQGTDFQPCQVPALRGDFYYSEDLDSLIYSREGLRLEPGFIDTAVQFFRNLFGIKEEAKPNEDFLHDTKNFRDLYLLDHGDKKVRAVREIYPDREKLVAEYENFQTPVCEYVTEQRIDLPFLQRSPLARAAGGPLLNCTLPPEKQNVQRVEAYGGLEFLWPQLTGKIRVQEE